MKVTKSVVIGFDQLKTAVKNLVTSGEIDIPVNTDISLQFYNGLQKEDVLANTVKVIWEDDK